MCRKERPEGRTRTSDTVIPFLCILGNHVAQEGEWRYRRLVLKQPWHSKGYVQQGGAGGESKAPGRAGGALERLKSDSKGPRDRQLRV